MANREIKNQKALLRERKENAKLGDMREAMLELLFHKRSGIPGPLNPEHHRGEGGGHGVTLEMKALPKPLHLVRLVHDGQINLDRDLKSLDTKKKHRKLCADARELAVLRAAVLADQA